MNRLTEAIKHLIIINVILFAAPQFLNLDLTNILALHFPQNESFGVWQYVTHMFLHADIRHIFFNMFLLFIVGSSVEQIWGKKKFFFFYFSAGIGAGLIYTLVNYYQFNGVYDELINMGVSANEIQNILTTGRYNDSLITISNARMSEFYNLYHTPAIGASGAVFGIFSASAVLFPNAEIRLLFLPFVAFKNKYFIATLIASDLFLGVFSFQNDNVARFAHVGGALVGFLIAWYWKKNQFKRWG